MVLSMRNMWPNLIVNQVCSCIDNRAINSNVAPFPPLEEASYHNIDKLYDNIMLCDRNEGHLGKGHWADVPAIDPNAR